MLTKKLKKGFSLLEIMVSLIIMSILIVGVSNGTSGFYKDFKYKDNVTKSEYLLKLAKMSALKKGSYVGTCYDGTKKTLTLKDLGAVVTSTTNPCDADSLKNIKSITVDRSLSVVSDPIIYDARGMTFKKGSLCIYYENGKKSQTGKNQIVYYKINSTLAGIYTSNGFGIIDTSGNCYESI